MRFDPSYVHVAMKADLSQLLIYDMNPNWGGTGTFSRYHAAHMPTQTHTHMPTHTPTHTHDGIHTF